MRRAAPFQRRTAEYAFRRLWKDQNGVRRFLVADEVGLGKTVVAREIIDLTLDHLAGEPVDIVYVSSSLAIAHQNLGKLKGRWSTAPTISTRLTLLAVEESARADRVRFLALTPGTSFTITGSAGLARERALLWRLLRGWLSPKGLETALRIVKPASWEAVTADIDGRRVDPGVAAEFERSVREEPGLDIEVRAVAKDAASGLDDKAFRRRRGRLVGRLRAALARAGARNIARRGLVILDEFQRYSNLVGAASAGASSLAAELAREVFARSEAERRVLLLSATPYRMPGSAGEQGDHPHEDLIALVGFLTGDDRQAAALEVELAAYARALRVGTAQEAQIEASRDRAQAILRRVMARTERVSATRARDGMIGGNARPLVSRPGDLVAGIEARRIAREHASHDTTEYWKSAPYLLDFMRDYDLKRKVLRACKDEAKRRALERRARKSGLLLNPAAVRGFRELDPPNARMRALLEEALPKRAERVLWVPPSLPYVEPAAPFHGAPRYLKTLVFSEWQLAPDAIASLVSYEVERRLVEDVRLQRGRSHARRSERPLSHASYKAVGKRLRLETSTRMAGKRCTEVAAGLSHGVLALLYPSPALACVVDPLAAACALGEPLPREQALKMAATAIRLALADPQIPKGAKGGRPDPRWYWAAPMLLDGRAVRDAWRMMDDPIGARKPGSARMAHSPTSEASGADEALVLAAVGGVGAGTSLGPRPRDLSVVLAEVALAGPGVCALRMLRRLFPVGPGREHVLMRAAFRIAQGFQNLFNQPDATLAVELTTSAKLPYWRQALAYALAGNLQSMLDEHGHMEAEGLSLLGKPVEELLDQASASLSAAMRLRTATVEVAGLDRRRRRAGSAVAKPDVVAMRGRHAVRFAEIRSDDGSVTRLDAVRAAFNSPFRPFVVASTSVGQEGLDFHTWCHSVCHWNLPAGPVELEQREGRVHRYKGHAVRLNVAGALGLSALRARGAHGSTDPWTTLFDLAEGLDDEQLSPCWIFDRGDNPVRIRRLAPMPDLSRETERWAGLIHSVALYRLVLGQPRQEDLMLALQRAGVDERQAARWRIDLTPPREECFGVEVPAN